MLKIDANYTDFRDDTDVAYPYGKAVPATSQLDLEKAEEPEIKFLTSAGSSKKQASSRKISISALLTMSKPLTVC